jgi:BirA family transcriptional regulator, biotin operon repressor / biotin---[acetyl-CoA-carboxylase] ligase
MSETLDRRGTPAAAPPPATDPLATVDDALTPAALQRCLRSAVLGHRVFYYPCLGSTNDRALELAAAGEVEGALVLAEEQTCGRGRRRRGWISPPRLGIYASLILRPGLETARAPLFTFLAAVSTADALREVARVEARIKWPNDVVVGRRKIAGVLGEMRGADATLRDMVIGLGVNVNQTAADFPEELRERATSVRIESGAGSPRAPILSAALEGFERRYARLLKDGPQPLLEEWSALSAIPPGGRVAVEGPCGRREGTVRGVDEEGALLLATDDGQRVRVSFGEIVEPLWV